MATMTDLTSHFVTTFYSFQKVQDPDLWKSEIENRAEKLNISGLIILGHEGLNATVSGTSLSEMNDFKKMICGLLQKPHLFFKDSVSEKAPFRRFKIKLRKEIVTAGVPDLQPPEEKNYHLSPEEWDQFQKENPDAVLIDTRNWYEYRLGTFKGALNPNIEKFTDFPTYIQSQGFDKNKKMMIFCTGGIRCEKGILELQKQGYSQVYQLEGGILNYMAKKPRQNFEGECFVFDHRVALDADLKPSTKYGLCPHCGQPSEIKITCSRCDSEELICIDCSHLDLKKETCSKNCAYQFGKHPNVKAPKQPKPWRPHEI